MPVFARHPGLRWIAPLLAAVLLGSAGAGVATFSAAARDSLVTRSADQLLADVQRAHLEGFSGTLVETANLGLPTVPDVGASSSDFTGLVSGSHTLRLWYAGPEKTRLALIGDLGESDLVRHGSDVWLWSSSTTTARHLSIPAPGTLALGGAETAARAITPQRAADMALKAITPSTTVTTDPTAVVAGRPAYELTLQPHDSGTLVGTVKIAIDGATHIPTRVQVFPRGSSDPALEVGFTSFDPTVPSDSVFAFTPPPGTTTNEGLGGSTGEDAGAPPTSGTAPGRPKVVGSGWTSVVVAPLPARPSGPADNSASPLASLGTVINGLPRVSGAWGSGHVLQGTLFSVLVTDDGRVVAGAVPPDALYGALSDS